MQRALDSLTGGFGITAEGTEDGLVVASSSEYASELTSGDGELGESAPFQRALPDADRASYLIWLDFAAISSAVALAEPDAAGVLSPLEGFGFTLSSSDSESGITMRARLVFADES
jgi:hypothetical protein